MTQRAASNVSPWTRREKVARVLWGVVWIALFRPSFHNWYGFRAMLLRIFGAKIGSNVRVRPSVRVEIPWNLRISDDVSIGDFVILYALAPIAIGARSFISQYAHLCAGTHDYTTLDYPLLRQPITIGTECWIAADAFIGPGRTIGDRAVIAARANVVKDVPPHEVWGGNPARFLKPRGVLQGAERNASEL